jgi:hypothetical protein
MDKNHIELEKILDEAKRLVTGSRQHDYGNFEDNFKNITESWGLLDHSMQPSTACMMMALLKIARVKQENVYKFDSYVDAIAYIAMSGVLRKKEQGNLYDTQTENNL